jgi:hypothetical protein
MKNKNFSGTVVATGNFLFFISSLFFIGHNKNHLRFNQGGIFPNQNFISLSFYHNQIMSNVL